MNPVRHYNLKNEGEGKDGVSNGMKRIISLITALITFLCLSSIALAGDSLTIAVSCTIPAIPGVNAPPFAAQETKNEKEETPEMTAQEQADKEKSTTIIDEEINSQLAMQTIYSR